MLVRARISALPGRTVVLTGIAILVAGCSSHPSASGPPAASSSPSGSGAGASTPASPPRSPATAPTSTGPAGGPVPAGFVPMSATFISAAAGWVLGTAPCAQRPCTSLVRTRDGGQSWQGVPAPKAELGRYPTDPTAGTVSIVRFADDRDGWVAGRGLYATHDGGASWHAVPVGGSSTRVTGLGSSAGRVYASVAGCSSDGTCAGTVTVYSAPISSDAWAPVAQVGAQDRASALVVAGSGWYLPTVAGTFHGQGSSPASRLANPCPAAAGQGPSAPQLAIADADHLDAVCTGDGAAGSASYWLYGSTDGGRSWQRAGYYQHQPSDLTGIADNQHGVLLLSAASGGSVLLRTTDDGRTLANASVSAPSGGLSWTDLGFTTSSQAVVVLVRSGLYLSHDAGASWTPSSF